MAIGRVSAFSLPRDALYIPSDLPWTAVHGGVTEIAPEGVYVESDQDWDGVHTSYGDVYIRSDSEEEASEVALPSFQALWQAVHPRSEGASVIHVSSDVTEGGMLSFTLQRGEGPPPTEVKAHVLGTSIWTWQPYQAGSQTMDFNLTDMPPGLHTIEVQAYAGDQCLGTTQFTVSVAARPLETPGEADEPPASSLALAMAPPGRSVGTAAVNSSVPAGPATGAPASPLPPAATALRGSSSDSASLSGATVPVTPPAETAPAAPSAATPPGLFPGSPALVAGPWAGPDGASAQGHPTVNSFPVTGPWTFVAGQMLASGQGAQFSFSPVGGPAESEVRPVADTSPGGATGGQGDRRRQPHQPEPEAEDEERKSTRIRLPRPDSF